VISADYVSVMARYNAWQNKQIMGAVDVMDEEALYRDHGAFFGSIMHTLNHLLWGDTLWMNRFSAAFEPPSVPAAEHTAYTPSSAAWQTARAELDARIIDWSQTVSSADLAGDLTWTSAMEGTTMRQPMALCVATVFNHQTHHRGQVHAMLTASGVAAPVSDLVLMPEDA